MPYPSVQAALARKFINGLKWIPGLFQGDTNQDRDSYQIIIGGIIDTIPYYNIFADARDTVYWLYVMYEDEEERTNVVTWIQLLITGIGWIYGPGDVIKVALKLLGKATDGFKNAKAVAKVLDKLFKEKKLGDFRKLFEKLDWSVLKKAKKKLKSSLEKGLELLVEYELNPKLQEAIKDILKDFDSMMDQAIDQLKSTVNSAMGEEPIPLIQHGHTGVSKTVRIPFDEPKPPKCPICGELHHEMDFDNKKGNNVGNSRTLRTNMYPKDSHVNHPHWYTTRNEEQRQRTLRLTSHNGGASLQAHHLIPAKSMKKSIWKKRCEDNKYNINNRNNGVMLPSWITLACQLKVPLHLALHDFKEMNPNYTASANNKLRKATKSLKKQSSGCDRVKFVNAMNVVSEAIFEEVINFEVLLTKDGKDYHPSSSKGCCQLYAPEFGQKSEEIIIKEDKVAAMARGSIKCARGRKHRYLGDHDQESFEAEQNRRIFTIGS